MKFRQEIARRPDFEFPMVDRSNDCCRLRQVFPGDEIDAVFMMRFLDVGDRVMNDDFRTVGFKFANNVNDT
jgi:hypothetical protein